MNIFLGMKILWVFFLCILGSFLKENVQNWDFLGVAKFSNIFGGS